MLIYPGHGNIIENPLERINFYINHRNEREKQIMKIFAQNPDKKLEAYDLVQQLYLDTPKNLWDAAALNVNHHLNKLEKEGKLLKMCIESKHYFMYKLQT